jgi:hypothetical protein
VDQGELELMRKIPDYVPVNERVMGISFETEWLGYYSGRTIINSIWGAEWEAYSETNQWHNQLQACRDSAYIREVAVQSRSEYLFLPLTPAAISSDQLKLLTNGLENVDGIEVVLIIQSAVLYWIDLSLVKSPLSQESISP